MWATGTVGMGAPVRRVLYLVICLSGCLLIVLLVRARRVTREQMTVRRGPGRGTNAIRWRSRPHG